MSNKLFFLRAMLGICLLSTVLCMQAPQTNNPVDSKEVSMKPYVNEIKQESTYNELNQHLVIDQKQEVSGNSSLKSFAMPTIVTILVAIIFVSLVLYSSSYYKRYMYRNRKPLFNAPRFLHFLYPRPVTYEQEISDLCSKYLEN